MQNPRQGYGEIKINLVSITEFDFNKSLVLKKLVNPLITEASDVVHKLHLRTSYYDFAIDKISGPIQFSEQKEILMSQGPE